MATDVGNQQFVDSLLAEVVEPGVQQMLAAPLFEDLRQGTLTTRRMQGIYDYYT